MNRPRRNKRLDRIERKCDRILAEVLILRHQRDKEIDDTIDRLHRSAKSLREQSRRERDIVRGMLLNIDRTHEH